MLIDVRQVLGLGDSAGPIQQPKFWRSGAGVLGTW